MKLINLIAFSLLIVFSFSCDRGYEDRSSKSQVEILSNSDAENHIPGSIAENPQIDSTETSITSEDSNNHIEGNSFGNATPVQDSSLADKAEASSELDQKWSLSEEGLVISLFLNLILIILFISLFRKNSSLNEKIKSKNQKLDEKTWTIKKLEHNLQQRNNRDVHRLQQDKVKRSHENNYIQNRPDKPNYPEEKSYEVVLDHKTTTPSTTAVETLPKVILYAGKPSDANTFSAVSPQQDEHRSIFKLILENKNSDKAKFEVIENEYILKMAANSPDTYLYHICKPENSNQNFDGRIVTTEQGTAHLVDGKWKVNDHEKATIKFQ